MPYFSYIDSGDESISECESYVYIELDSNTKELTKILKEAHFDVDMLPKAYRCPCSGKKKAQ